MADQIYGAQIGLYHMKRRREAKIHAEKKAYLDSKANEFYIEYLDLMQTGKVTAEEAMDKVARDHDYSKTFVAQAIKRQERQALASYSPIGPKHLLAHVHALDKSIEEMRAEIETQIFTAEEALEKVDGDTPADITLRMQLEDRILNLRSRLVATNKQFGEHLSKFLPTGDRNVLTNRNGLHNMSLEHINQELARLEGKPVLETEYEEVEKTEDEKK